MNGLCESVVTFLIAYTIVHTGMVMSREQNSRQSYNIKMDSCEMGDIHIACLGMIVLGQIGIHRNLNAD